MKNALCTLIALGIIVFCNAGAALETYKTTYVFETEIVKFMDDLEEEAIKEHIASQPNLSQEEIDKIHGRVLDAWMYETIREDKSILRGCADEVKKFKLEELYGKKRNIIDGSLLETFEKHKKDLSNACINAMREHHGEMLTEDAIIHGVKIPALSYIKTKTVFENPIKKYMQIRVSSDPDNIKIKQMIITPIKPIVYKNRQYEKRIVIENGNFTAGHLVNDTMIKNTLYKAGAIVYQMNGDIFTGTLAKDTAIQGIPLQKNTKVIFHHNGMLNDGTLASDVSYQNIPLKKGTTIHLHKNRYLSGGTVAQDTTIGEHNYKAGHVISFKEDGTLRKR